MKEKNTNKFLLMIIIFLAVIIVMLAVILALKISGVFSKNNGESSQYVSSCTEENITTLGTEYELDVSKYPLGIYYIEGEEVDNTLYEGEDYFYYEGGTYLNLKGLNETHVSFSFNSISSPPANRIAELTINDAEIIEGKAEFTFDNDGWYNRGKGYIKFKGDGKIELYVDITRMSEDAMFSIYAGTHTLIFDHKSQ